MPLLHRAIHARPGERVPALAAFALLLCLFGGYFMLRPVRETMGIAGGVENLQWLFSATFAAMLLAVPAYGWLNARVPRRVFLDCVYLFFASNLLGFAWLLWRTPDPLWAARTFYVWLSVYNLFAISLAWSLLADVFDRRQSKRLFPAIAAGASLGGMIGPLAGGLLVGRVGIAGLLVLAALLLLPTLALRRYLMTWRGIGGAGRHGAENEPPERPVPGNPFAGISLVLGSPYLLGICAFVLLLSCTSTFLYFEQARLVAALFPDSQQQVRVFSLIDFAVQALSLICQLFIAGRVAQRFGVGALLAGVPLLVSLGFLALALLPQFAVLAGVMVLRRVGEYAFVRPGREMLFVPLGAQLKYRAKNFIDTVVYRGGDALSAWLNALLNGIGLSAALVALVGAGVALAWSALGWRLGQRHEHTESPATSQEAKP
ncbi:NTP/NDP exchange transporter [Pseudomonas sp. TCU-HL1]|uniref:NTP/NDP exchange transporter n=1 Tax=Pseudomonas sp. TCU-HL1 TaxID=1856685 RepID=UPI00083E32B7|nr:MFS transporter [Pseudomonas sp. TCU-HL1]AOE86389.1 ADP/ATP translocating protein [Pseudomonas sp. TCU-HL1]